MINPNVKSWLHGLFAAAIGSFATAAGGALTLPGVFNTSHNGLINFAKITVVPALITVFAYLKQSPLPSMTVTATTINTVTTEVTPNEPK
jgi:hypothetical protein